MEVDNYANNVWIYYADDSRYSSCHCFVVYGPGKLPELGKAMGKGIKEFKSASDGDENKEEVKAQ